MISKHPLRIETLQHFAFGFEHKFALDKIIPLELQSMKSYMKLYITGTNYENCTSFSFLLKKATGHPVWLRKDFLPTNETSYKFTNLIAKIRQGKH